jgi:surface antigen
VHKRKARLSEHRNLSIVVIAALLTTLAFALPPSADAADTVTYSATQTIPVPPASTYAGSGGGDGWAVAMTSTAVYNVFHHSTSLEVACHLQSDASECWAPKTITDASGTGFAVSGHPGLWIDQATGRLSVYATRASDQVGGVVCVDTTQPGDVADPFCGFTALTTAGDSPVNGWGAISAPVVVGSRWYAMNYAPSAGADRAQNHLLCFDLAAQATCDAQPFALDLGGSVMTTSWPSPLIAAIGTQIVVPARVDGSETLACFDTVTRSECAGTWPATPAAGYAGQAGAPVPTTDPAGRINGFCLPTGTDACFTLSGAATAAPSGLAAVVGASDPWNGPALLLGPRVYVPNGNTNSVQCFDYSADAACAGFPKSFANLNYLYTVNADPQRPDCIWVNADGGSGQIQNFDAYNGNSCGQGPIRVLASSIVVPTDLCLPGSYQALQVTAPPRDAYTSGTVQFLDGAGRPISSAADRALDGTGSADLSNLSLNTATGLPQFLISLVGAQTTPGSVTVKLTWTGVFDPSCVKPGTSTSGGGGTGGAVQFVSPSPVQGALVGVKKNTTVTVDVAASGSSTIVLRTLAAPAGATFSTVAGNPATGRLAWTPRTADNVLVTIEARDTTGRTATRTFTVMSYEGSKPPALTVPATTTGSSTYAAGGGRGAAGGWSRPPSPRPAAQCPSMTVSSIQDASGIPPNYHGPLFVDAAPVSGCIAAARSLAGYGNIGGATNAAHQWGTMGEHPWGVNLVQDFKGGAWGTSIIMQGCSTAITWTGECANPYLPAFVVRGGIWETYRTGSGLNRLGPPLGNESAADDHGGVFQLFAGGMIVWSAARGGRIVTDRPPNAGAADMDPVCDHAWSVRGYAGRNCTDYVAWRMAFDGHPIPGGMGNATDWPDSFKRKQWPMDQTPRPGDAAVQSAQLLRNGYGHVAYVRAVNPDGTLSIEDYNRHPRCQYSITENVDPGNFTIFIHPPVEAWS